MLIIKRVFFEYLLKFQKANFCEFNGQLISLYNGIKKYIETIKDEAKIK